MANNRLLLVNHTQKKFLVISKTHGYEWQGLIQAEHLDNFLRETKADGQFGDTESDKLEVMEENGDIYANYINFATGEKPFT